MMTGKFLLACDVRGRYVLQATAQNLNAAKRKASVMLIPGMVCLLSAARAADMPSLSQPRLDGPIGVP